MKHNATQIIITGSIVLGSLLDNTPAKSQVSSDGTLPTKVERSGNVSEITGGERAGNNLFHSFKEFSIPTNNTAFFNNAANIVNIISRVTGGNVSNIDGLIRAQGGANLILINPSGINFGPNARLSIGGSFLGSTANTIEFADGTEFSAIDSDSPPLLTISVPVGLQMGENGGAIRVSGEGHNLSVSNPIFSPFTRGNEVTGLQVQPGETLALVGGNIFLDGGTLTAEGGQVELASIASGLVKLDSNWNFNYKDVSNFRDISLQEMALIDASSADGMTGGSINLQGRNLSVENGSQILVQNRGLKPAGAININTTESFKISDASSERTIRSSITNESVRGAGDGGDISISTGELVIESGATILTRTFGSGSGGNVKVSASESVRVIGTRQSNPDITSSIVSATYGDGDSGNSTITTRNLTLSGGGTIASSTFNEGDGGNLNIDASGAIAITGVEPTLLRPSIATASTFNEGNAGELTIDTNTLTLKDGGRVDASTFASGNAGSVTINASEIEVTGTVPNSRNPSLIISSGNVLDQSLRDVFNVSGTPSGSSGNVIITTDRLRITDGAEVSVTNEGIGESGTLQIDAADSIFLDTQGSITAELGIDPQEGQNPETGIEQRSGNIVISTRQLNLHRGARISTITYTDAPNVGISIDASESVTVQGSSPDNPNFTTGISASTFASGDGGDVSVSTGELKILDGAFISSGVFDAGDGGNVTINAAQSVEVTGSSQPNQLQPNQSQPSLLGVSTFDAGNAGELTVNTGRLVVQEGATIDASSRTRPTPNAGEVRINASQSVANEGIGKAGTLEINADSIFLDTEGSITAELRTEETRNTGIDEPSGKIDIETRELNLQRGARISTITYTDAPSDGISINASESVTVEGFSSEENPSSTSGISASNFFLASGSGGDVSVSTRELKILDGAFVSSGVLGTGDGGNLEIEAQSVEVTGNFESEGFVQPSLLGVSTFNSGNAGDLTVNTERLVVQEGARIDASTFASGSSGNLTIEASQSVEIGDSSFVGSIADRNTPVPERFRLVESPQGSLREVNIITDRLRISNGGQLAVRNDGTNGAGSLTVDSNSILLENDGTINAAAASGEGGNIILTAENIQLRDGSEITATAEEDGNGGNITIDTDTITLLEESNLIANATRGSGGDIQIEAQAIFTCPGPDCEITASSDFGVDGEVDFNTPDTETDIEQVDLPQEVTNPEEVVALSCAAEQSETSSQLIITGRGGIPPSPRDPITSEALVGFDSPSTVGETPLEERRDNLDSSGVLNFVTSFNRSRSSLFVLSSSFTKRRLSSERIKKTEEKRSEQTSQTLPPPAQNLYVNAQGEIVLTAEDSNQNTHNSALISSDCHYNKN